MKTFWFLLFLVPILFSCQSEKSVKKYSFFTGDIEYNEQLDGADFKGCNPKESFSYQYYSFSGFDYEGEKLEIIKALEKTNIHSDKKVNGYITVRFLINCEGKSGMFRLVQMNNEYKESVFDQQLANQLLNFTKSLKGWKIQQSKGKNVDYYQYLTYTIVNGAISEILP